MARPSRAFKSLGSRRSDPKKPKCYKVKYDMVTASLKAASAEDWRGKFVAYPCPGTHHWHIGHPTPGTKVSDLES